MEPVGENNDQSAYIPYADRRATDKMVLRLPAIADQTKILTLVGLNCEVQQK